MQFISKKETCALVTISQATLDRWEAAGQFPKRVPLGEDAPVLWKRGTRAGRYKSRNCRVVYVLQEVLDWMEARVAKRNALSTGATLTVIK